MSDTRFRWGVASASAWRIVAELYRRHAHARDLRIMHLHPGLSSRGILRLQEGWTSGEAPRVDIVLGGGGDGRIELVPWKRTGERAEERWSDPRAVHELLISPDPKRVVDDIERAAGLPRAAELPPSTPRVIAVRVIAEILERHALARTMLRASCGFLDASSGSDTLTWASEVREVAEEMDRARTGDALARAEPASWIWAIHATDNQGSPAGSELPRGAIIIDVKRSRAWAAMAPERVINLPVAYQERQREIVRLTRDVEALV